MDKYMERVTCCTCDVSGTAPLRLRELAGRHVTIPTSLYLHDRGPEAQEKLKKSILKR